MPCSLRRSFHWKDGAVAERACFSGETRCGSREVACCDVPLESCVSSLAGAAFAAGTAACIFRGNSDLIERCCVVECLSGVDEREYPVNAFREDGEV